MTFLRLQVLSAANLAVKLQESQTGASLRHLSLEVSRNFLSFAEFYFFEGKTQAEANFIAMKLAMNLDEFGQDSSMKFGPFSIESLHKFKKAPKLHR